jgi:hypothetical protein
MAKANYQYRNAMPWSHGGRLVSTKRLVAAISGYATPRACSLLLIWQWAGE